jgi:hypothetical protein
MKFKNGDRVICIEIGGNLNLVLGEQYTIRSTTHITNENEIKYIVKLVEIVEKSFYARRFKLLTEFRKEKIKQLRNGI